MSASFEDPKIGDRNLAVTPASSFNSSTERTLGVSNCDESDDTDHPCSSNTYESSWSQRNRKTNQKLYIKSTIKSDGTNYADPDTDVSDENRKLPPIQELRINSALEDEALPKIEDLTLDSESESLTINNKIADLSLNSDNKPLAGVVTSVAKSIGLIVAKPSPMQQDVLLYLGSPVFFKKSSMDLGSKYVKLGWIIDVFGPACEPYYCVKPINNGIELVHEGTQLFYSPDHSRTAYLCLKREDGNRYTVLYSPRWPGNRDNRKGRSGERNLSDNTSEINSFNRQSFRRRYRGNDRGTYGYRNKYRDNFYPLRPLQPKHSYFDY